MKPPERPDIVATLNTLPECKVLLDALEDSQFMADHEQSDRPLSEHTGVRFRMQARQLERPLTADSYAEDRWGSQPEFDIKIDDVAFVLEAAQRTLATHNLGNRLFNKLTGRAAAARTIVRWLSI